jgi:hypothetical protein
MEFYVIDPKDGDFAAWTQRVRGFLQAQSLPFTEAEGQLYFIGDDVATPWDEGSVLFTVEDDENPGVVEVRDADRNVYVFSDDLAIFDEREVRSALGVHSFKTGAVFGFEWANAKACRFHLGPSERVSYFCEGDEADCPSALELPDTWQLFFRVCDWIGSSTSRIQDLKLINVERAYLDFEVQVNFKHPASLDVLNEILTAEDGFERTKTGLRATFRERDLAWIRDFVSLLPQDNEDFDDALFRAVWRGLSDGEEKEVFYVGVERRKLRPFVQLPVHRTSKQLIDKVRTHFKGHRIDRQDYVA